MLHFRNLPRNTIPQHNTLGAHQYSHQLFRHQLQRGYIANLVVEHNAQT